MVLEKIRTAAKDGTLSSTPDLVSILHRWKDWSKDEGEVKEWISEIAKSDEDFPRLLEHFGSIQLFQLGGDLAARREFRLDPKRFEPFIETDKIIDQARIIAERENLPEGQIAAAKQFV